jgi:long-subunit fatty acid transport protein
VVALLASLGAVALTTTVAQATLVGSIASGPTSAGPATVYWNPAAMTLVKGTQGLLFGAISSIRLSYQRDTPSAYNGLLYPEARTNIPGPDGSAFVVTDAGLERWRFGMGVSFPVVDGVDWDGSYGGQPSSTRHFALVGRSITAVTQASAAFRINRYVSVGAGVDVFAIWVQHRAMTDFGAIINQLTCAESPMQNCPLNAPLAREDPVLDALTNVEGLGWGVGGYFGVLVTPIPALRIGGSFHSGAPAVTVPIEVSVSIPTTVADSIKRNLPTVTLPPIYASGAVETTAPMMVTAGVAYDLTPALELSADFHWIDSSATTVMLGTVASATTDLVGDQVMIKAKLDHSLVGLRAAYHLLEPLWCMGRVEYSSNTRPEAYLTPVSLDFHRLSLHVGASWQVTRWLALSLEYGHIFTFERTVTVSRFAPNASPTTLVEAGFDKPSATGRYTGAGDRVGLGVTLSWPR